ncbi:MAG: hypothetical protein E6G11_12465 [Actinobacteria bacterium]|nr:MAG: hypothetical protein E6G11_12465 [Actinomycetota bacterium]
MRRTARFLGVLLLAAVFVGSAAGATRLQRHAVPGQGVSLAVPGFWVVVDSKLPQEFVDRLSRENPRLAPFIRSLQTPNGPTKFIALDPAVREGFATNVNVVVAPVPSSMTFPAYRLALTAEIQSLVPGQRVAQKVVTINGARAVRLRYRLRLQLGRAFTVQTLQYAFLRRGRSVVVTYTTLPGLVSRYARTFARSAATIRFSAP